MSTISILVIGGFVFYVMNTQERERALRPVLILLSRTHAALCRLLAGSRWLVVGMVTGNPWAVTAVVTALTVVLNAQTPRVDWPALPDLQPEIERLIAIEENNARIYDAAVAQFKLGAITAEGLVRVIKTSLIPELQDTNLRLQSLDRVRAEHRSLLLQAREYLQLRSESWRLRAEALERRSMATLKLADRIEHVSLDVLQRVRHEEER